MHIQYQIVTLEGIKKTADIMYGIYEMEHSDNAPFKRWVWTSDVFGGVLQKIDTIDFRIKSPIDNDPRDLGILIFGVNIGSSELF